MVRKKSRKSKKQVHISAFAHYRKSYARGFLMCRILTLAGIACEGVMLGCIRRILLAAQQQSENQLVAPAILFIPMLLVELLLLALREKLGETICNGIENHAIFDLYEHITEICEEQQEYAIRLEREIRENRDCRRLSAACTKGRLQIGTGILRLAVLLVLLALCHWSLMLTGAAGALVLSLGFDRIGGRREAAGRRQKDVESQIDLFCQNLMNYIHWIRLYHMEDYFKARLTELQKKKKKAVQEAAKQERRGHRVFRLVYSLILSGSVVQGSLLACQGTLNPGAYLWALLLFGLTQLQAGILRVRREEKRMSRQADSRIRQMLALKEDDRKNEEWAEILRLRARDGLSLHLEQVEYRKNSGENVFHSISLEAYPGEWIAVDNAEGETAELFRRLLLGQISPSGGELKLCHEKGVECEISAATRTFFGVIEPEGVLFPGTIADNLRLGQFAVTEKRIWESLECVLAAEEIRKLPQGLGTLVSPLNHPFSPELLQKLMIARAILMDCAIYLIGDLTAGFSHETEREILRRLRQQWRSKTCLFLSPRLPVLSRCDRIYQLRQNEIVPAGDLIDPDGIRWEDVRCSIRRIAEVFA